MHCCQSYSNKHWDSEWIAWKHYSWIKDKRAPTESGSEWRRTNKAAAYAKPYQKEKGVISTAGKGKNSPILHPPFPAFSEKSKHTS